MEPGGQLNMQQLLQAAAAMQSQLMSAQQELADAEIKGSASGGLVTVTVNGQGELTDVTIKPAAIEGSAPADAAQTVADLVLAAYRDACRQADGLQQQTMAPFASGLGGGGMPGMPDLAGFPGLAGLPGGDDFEDDDDFDDEDFEDDDEFDDDDDDDTGEIDVAGLHEAGGPGKTGGPGEHSPDRES